MRRDEPAGLEEQLLSKGAELSISTQIDRAEKLDVDVKTDLVKMAQGQVDSVAVEGRGIVVKKDIRVQEIEMHADNIAIDLLSFVFGKVELTQPTDATVRMVLTEEDMNRTLNSDYITSKLSPLKLDVDGQVATVELQPPLELRLPGDGKMVFSGNILLHDPEGSRDTSGEQRQNYTRSIGFTGVIHPRTQRQPLLLESFNCTPGQGFSLGLITALMQKVKDLVNLPFFEINGMVLRIKDMQVQQGRLTLETEAIVKQLP